MSEFHRLLAVKFPLLAGQHESHESVSSPESKEHEQCVSSGNNQADEEGS